MWKFVSQGCGSINVCGKFTFLFQNNYVSTTLRELAASGDYSKKVIEYLYDQESEEISLDLIVELIKHIHCNQGEGAILVFLPGWDKISTLHKMLTQQGYSERSKSPFCHYVRLD